MPRSAQFWRAVAEEVAKAKRLRPCHNSGRTLYAKPGERGYRRNHNAPKRAIWPLAMSVSRDKVHVNSRFDRLFRDFQRGWAQADNTLGGNLDAWFDARLALALPPDHRARRDLSRHAGGRDALGR